MRRKLLTVRPIPFHNLDSATDVHRVTDFIVANLQTSSQEPKDLTKELARIIEHPPDRKLTLKFLKS